MKKYKVLLFDLDDTILSFEKGEDYAITKLCEFYGIEASEDNKKRYSEINKSYWKKLEKQEIEREALLIKRFEDFFGEMNLTKNQDKTNIANDVYFEYLSSVAYIIDGAVDAIRKLKKKYHIYLITNGVKRVQDGRLSLVPEVTELLEKRFISEEVGYTKPQKGFLDAVLKESEYSKDEMLIIGDSLSSDMALGLNNGVDTCWFNPKGKQTDLKVNYIVKDYDELLELLN